MCNMASRESGRNQQNNSQVSIASITFLHLLLPHPIFLKQVCTSLCSIADERPKPLWVFFQWILRKMLLQTSRQPGFGLKRKRMSITFMGNKDTLGFILLVTWQEVIPSNMNNSSTGREVCDNEWTHYRTVQFLSWMDQTSQGKKSTCTT